MSRSPAAGFNTAVGAAHLEEVLFVEFQFTSGTVYACSREHNVAWNSQTWLGAGKVGSVSPIEEAGQLEPKGLELVMAVSAELLAIALDPAEYKNRTLRLWYGLLDTSSAAAITVVADPVGPFVYFMDTLDFELGETGLLKLTAESRLADWTRPRVRRYNNADQQDAHPGDRFFEYAEQMVEASFLW